MRSDYLNHRLRHNVNSVALLPLLAGNTLTTLHLAELAQQTGVEGLDLRRVLGLVEEDYAPARTYFCGTENRTGDF